MSSWQCAFWQTPPANAQQNQVKYSSEACSSASLWPWAHCTCIHTDLFKTKRQQHFSRTPYECTLTPRNWHLQLITLEITLISPQLSSNYLIHMILIRLSYVHYLASPHFMLWPYTHPHRQVLILMRHLVWLATWAIERSRLRIINSLLNTTQIQVCRYYSVTLTHYSLSNSVTQSLTHSLTHSHSHSPLTHHSLTTHSQLTHSNFSRTTNITCHTWLLAVILIT